MLDLKKLQTIISQSPEKKNLPKHIIINFSLGENVSDHLKLLEELIKMQTEVHIPIWTISLGQNIKHSQDIVFLFDRLHEYAKSNKVNISVIGRWYSVEGELVESLKRLNNDTKDFDHYFLNLCINYDSQQEIADATKLMVVKAINNKIDYKTITPEVLKQNIYSANLLPPDLIIEPQNTLTGTFLWDSVGAKIFFLNKKTNNVTKQDMSKALDWYSTL